MGHIQLLIRSVHSLVAEGPGIRMCLFIILICSFFILLLLSSILLFNHILELINFKDIDIIPENYINNIYLSLKDFVNDIINDFYNENKSQLEKDISDLCENLVTIFNIYKNKYDLLNPIESKYLEYATISELNCEEKYKEIVKKNQFGNYKLTSDHLFFSSKSKVMKSQTTMRILSEFSSLKKNMPINWDSSILMRICKTNLNLITFLIVGPKDTPYHNGLFEFHAYFPDDYPYSVPNVLLKTTGGGRVRFNPNLYNSGKVCLSLLGTWSGEQGESWNRDISTFLQVLISIQSLIFVEKPYFNEPGYENSMNTDKGDKLNAEYSDNIRLETIREAINNTIENKKEYYSDFIDNHFKAKYNEICKTIESWIDESKSKKALMINAYKNFKYLMIKVNAI